VTAGFSIFGVDNDDRISGFTTGDMNGDGRKDLILSSPYMNVPGGNGDVGGVAVVSGRSSGAGSGDSGIDLANLGTNGWLFRGVESLGVVGMSLGFIGDVNGDNVGDMIVGAPSEDSRGKADSGAAYIVFGSATPLGTLETVGANSRYVLTTAQLTSGKGFVFVGLTPGDTVGASSLGISSTSDAQDFNGDGIADFFIGARDFDRVLASGQTAASDVGGVFVVFGQASGTAYGTLNATTGRMEMSINDLTADKGFIIRGGAAGDQAGYSIASAGDVNGDGVADLLIGAAGVNRGTVTNAGAAYVIYGKKTKNGEQTWSGLTDDPTMSGRKILDLGTLKTEDGFMIWGENQNGEFGRSVEGLGDINGDGFDDIVVGAPVASGSGGTAAAGSAYVILGSGSTSGQGTAAVSPTGRQILDVSAMTSAQGFIIRGVTEVGAQLGRSVGAAGDVNGDGLADVMVTAPYLDKGAIDAVGRAYIILGKNVGEGWGQSVSGQSILDLTNFGVADGFSIVG
ncbi:MAG: integrin alpha, partial [Sphingomonadaceae bacterium]